MKTFLEYEGKLLHTYLKLQTKKKKKQSSWNSESALNVPQIVVSDFSVDEFETTTSYHNDPTTKKKRNWSGRSEGGIPPTSPGNLKLERMYSRTFSRNSRLSQSESCLPSLSYDDDDGDDNDDDVDDYNNDENDDVFEECSDDETETSSDFNSQLTKSSSKETIATDRMDPSSSESETNLHSTKHGLKHLSRSTPTMSPSGSPPHSDSEGQSHVSRRTKKFLRRFRNVPPTERVINYYACAIVSDILWQGTLYITDNYFAFYSNIFGYVNRTLIPISDVSSIRKERTAKFIPNAVGLHTLDGKTIVFSSLISRDATYKFMTHIWKKSRKIDDSDKEIHIQVPEDNYLNDSASNSCDSNLEDNVDYNEEVMYYPPSIPNKSKPVWSSPPKPHVGAEEQHGCETSVTNSENDSSYTTPETCLSTNSFLEVPTSVDPLGTSASENEVRIVRNRGNAHQKIVQNNTKVENEDIKKAQQKSLSAAVMENAINIGVAPFRAVKDGLQEITFMPNNSAILFISSGIIFFLLLSAAFMIYRVETLNSQLNADSNQYGDLYEEVLKMQQKLHAATAKEIEKTLNHQISQLVTVRQSLEAIIFLLDADHHHSSQPSHVADSTTYS